MSIQQIYWANSFSEFLSEFPSEFSQGYWANLLSAGLVQIRIISRQL